MSTDPSSGPLRQDGAGGVRLGQLDRYSPMLPAQEAAEIARNLTAKYGRAALSFAHERAARAVEVGDDIARDAWKAVIEATQALLQRPAGG